MERQYRYVSIGNGLWARSRRIESLVEQYISASRPNARIRRAIRTARATSAATGPTTRSRALALGKSDQPLLSRSDPPSR